MPSLLVCYIADEVEREGPLWLGVPDPGASWNVVLWTAVHDQGHRGLAQNGQEGWAGTWWDQRGWCVLWFFPEHVPSVFARHGALGTPSREGGKSWSKSRRKQVLETSQAFCSSHALLGQWNQQGWDCCPLGFFYSSSQADCFRLYALPFIEPLVRLYE